MLSWTCGQKIEPQRTLIIFDEVQECNDALNSLKYFCEQMPEYAIVCAGSLLGVALNRSGASFPVGKVDFMHLYSVSFQEYLDTVSPHLSQVLSSVNSFEPLPELLHAQLLDSYKVYLALGGMPEAVSRYADTHDWIQTDAVQAEILKAYAFDFSKHINNKDIPRVFSVWANIQEQLAATIVNSVTAIFRKERGHANTRTPLSGYALPVSFTGFVQSVRDSIGRFSSSIFSSKAFV